MATMNISLPQEMRDWVEAQVATGRYANASDYVRDVIRHQIAQSEAQDEFDRIVQEALDSGTVERSKEELLESARAAARRKGLID